MKEIRLGLKIIKTLVKDRIFYPGRLLVDITALVMRCGLLLALYSYVFKLNAGQIKGYSYVVAAWSMFFYFIFLTLRLRDLSLTIMDDVRSGNIEVLLNKPISYLYYRIVWQLGTGLFSFLVLGVLGTGCMLALIGLPEGWDTFRLLTLCCSFFLCCTLCLILYSALGICAFWFEDIMPMQWLLDKFIMMFAGAYVPIVFLPSLLQKIAIYSPFGAAISISNVAFPSWTSDWPRFLGIQVFWIAIFAVLLAWIFNRAQKRLSINGG